MSFASFHKAFFKASLKIFPLKISQSARILNNFFGFLFPNFV